MLTKSLSFDAPRAEAVTVEVSATSAQSAALEAGDYLYLADQGSNLLFGDNPTATTSCIRVPADTLVRIAGVQQGEKVAIIADAAGTAWLAKA